MITQQELKSILNYNPDTGIFTWIKSNRSIKSGAIAGCYQHGYHIIRINGKLEKAHRLAFLYQLGFFPPDYVDHIDGNKANNIFLNLRLCNNKQNQRNRGIPLNNTSGAKGVRISGSKFRATIYENNKQINIGSFNTKEEASAAYIKAAKELFGEFYHG